MNQQLVTASHPLTAWGHVLEAVLCALAILGLPAATRAETVTAEPDAFLEYVETNQDSSDSAKVTQYIDTGIKAETGLKARMDAVVLSATRSDSAILGARRGSDYRFLMLHSNNKNAFAAYGYGNTGKWNDTVKHPIGMRFEEVADFSDGTAIQIYLNGQPRVSQAQQATIQSVAEDPATGTISASWMNNLTLYLFAANNGGAAAWPCRIRLYELKILKENSTTGNFDLLRHYLPCIKDGHAGLYDKVNGTISYSYGSAELVAGPVLDKPLDFVKSITSVSGDNSQYFDTWVWGKSGLRSEVDVSVRDYGGDHAILASRGSSGETRLYMAYHYQQAFRFAHGALPAKSDLNVVVPTNNVLTATQNDVRYLIKTDTAVGAQSCKVSRNGGEAVEILKSNVDYGATFSTYLATTNTLYLLAIHKYDGYPTCPSSCVLYGAKIWDGDELLRDFVPVVATNSSGVAYAGLYDQVAKRIHKPMKANLKNGIDNPFDLATSQVGAVTNTLRAVNEPKIRLEYVDSDYNYDYVDLGVIANAGLEMEATLDWLSIPGERSFIGARGSSGNSTPRIYLYSAYNNNGTIASQHAFHYNSSAWTARDSQNNGITMKADTTYKVRTRIDAGEQSITVWERKAGAWEQLGTRNQTRADDIRLGIPLYMFKCNDNGIPRYPVKARCRSLKLSVKQQDGTYALVRDLVPVLDPVTGGAAFWDKATETFFRNAGKYRLAGGGTGRAFQGAFMMIVR